MRCTSWLCAPAAAGLLAVLVSADAAAAPKKDPPGTSLIMAQLRATFAAWDLDGDGYLDKSELAKAFRGSDAKPYDYKPAPKDGDKKDDETKDDDTSNGKSSSTTKPDYSKYPDYNFLVALDGDNDQKISKDEFETWARDYAVSLKQQIDTLTRIAAAEQKLAALQNAATKKEATKEIRAAEADLKKEQAAYKKMTKQVKNFEKALQQAMKQNSKK
jgi:hypothetical protein